MPQFFARVELHGYPTYDVYEKLHSGMAKYGFGRKLNGKDLPTGTYYKAYSTSITSAERDNCRAIANSTGFQNSVVVVQSNDWAGYF